MKTNVTLPSRTHLATEARQSPPAIMVVSLDRVAGPLHRVGLRYDGGSMTVVPFESKSMTQALGVYTFLVANPTIVEATYNAKAGNIDHKPKWEPDRKPKRHFRADPKNENRCITCGGDIIASHVNGVCQD